jgi:hypothetical protein
MRCLELFSGSGSVGRAFRERGWEVYSLDISDRLSQEELTWKIDILNWRFWELDLPHFDVIWASPPCTEFSRAKTTGVRDLDKADKLVTRALQIIAYLQPEIWFLENPWTGLLKTRPMMQDMPYRVVTYCAYGYGYKKQTAIWSNRCDDEAWVTHTCPGPGECAQMTGRRHNLVAQRRPTVVQGTLMPGIPRQQLYTIPPQLCDDIADYCGQCLSDPGFKNPWVGLQFLRGAVRESMQWEFGDLEDWGQWDVEANEA